jgi:hypothetical protein
MTDTDDRLERVLLDNGMEDLIPTAQAARDPEVHEAVGGDDLIPTLSRVLERLVRLGELRLYRGHWHADPRPVAADQAAELLGDPAWYSFHLEDPDEERLYFINVKNLRDP